MNPWLLIGFIVALIGAYFGGDYQGHKNGIAEQKVADQVQFDKLNQGVADQKTKAATLLATMNAENLALMTERETLKTNLETQHAKDAKATDDLRRKYSGYSLRFQPTQVAGCGLGGSSTASTSASAASVDAAPSIELPAAINRRLFDIADDANRLADSYRECYGYAQQVR